MLPPTNLLGILMAFTSALVWGSADFTGGMATRRRDSYQVLVLSALSGLGILVIGALVFRENFPSWKGVFWAALAGIGGILGIGGIYKGLAIGESAVVAPTSAVIGAGLPVAFGFLTQGLPDPLRLVGFGLAFAGIWIVSQTSTLKTGDHRKGFLLACVSGLGFGGFMICMSRVESTSVFSPLIVARSMVVLGTWFMLRLNKQSFPALRGNWIMVLTGVLDVGGNIFFMLAKHFTRLDTAVVLSSLYPAATVILAGLILKEHISLKQWGGVIVCLAAIVLITL